MDADRILSILITALGTVSAYMIAMWIRSWSARLKSHDEKIQDHEVRISVLARDVTHIKETGDTVSANVEKLLERGNKRATG